MVVPPFRRRVSRVHDDSMPAKRWSENVTEHSKRRKGSTYQSAMSMLTFYINRAGKNLPKSRLRTLKRAKDELRKAFARA